ncbi:bifunctional oligoribonuclease/PAP phosphatase NrnA [Telluribacter sp. SYSU D00476]|uniref:DHH family phosphoesterase n=1 Tax=Telluribacter sp. SYSU D00476 TaxID=2811430 RepID=UPI001FF40A14|nr:bifunctional oligoribonuclease/PAP phosphatase NrnA [Telluribacter sp. SYSU D00476]
MNQAIDALRDLLSQPQRIIITMHRDPDADALGSSLGWALFLRRQGHQVTVISPTDYPNNLRWLPGIETVMVYEESGASRKICQQHIEQATLICCLDFSALSRLKDLGKVVQEATATKLLVDHHLEPEQFADLMVWDTNAAATAQLIYQIIKALDPNLFQNEQDIPLAECLYAGIMTDTGSFRHASTTPEVHLAVADMMHTGFELNRVHRLIFDSSPLSRLQLLGHALSKIHVLPEYRTSYMTLTAADLELYSSSVGDTDGIVNYGLQVEDVVMSALFIERKDEVKISFRSAGDFSVRDLAHAYFNGGGHKNASGGRTTLSLAETVQSFLAVLPEYQAQLQSVR